MSSRANEADSATTRGPAKGDGASRGSGGSQRGGGKPLSPRKLVRRARELVKEARSLLKRKRKRVPQAGQDALQAAIERTRAALTEAKANPTQRSHDALMSAAVALDERMEQDFGRWRKSQTREFVEAILWALALAAIIRFFLIEAFSIPSSSMMPTLQIGDHLFVNKISHGIYWPLSPHRAIAWNQPDPGDIIVFDHYRPGGHHHGEDYIKRVIGQPGDRVALRDNRLYINDVAVPTKELGVVDCPIYPPVQNVEEPAYFCKCMQQEETIGGTTFVSQHFTREQTNPQCGGFRANSPDWPEDAPYVVVPEGHFFVMGDNRDQSEDARYWGKDQRTGEDYGFVEFDRIKGTAFVIWWARDKGRLFDGL